MTDREVIERLAAACKFRHVMDGDRCTEISFHDENELFGGTVRKHPGKAGIVETAAGLRHLKHFDVRKCKLCRLPELASRSLEYLDLSCNDLESVPGWVTQQSRLKFLNLGANKIRDVPDLSGLPLETLKLHKNGITEMPATGTAVRSLNLYLNPMHGIPVGVLGLSGLEVFSFGVTDTESLPALSSLPNLRWLTLTVNRIEALPDDICSLKKLEGLQLAKNRLRRLPERVGEMNLRALTLYSNEISELPESFFDLRLEKLNLARNPLKDKARPVGAFGGIDFLRI